MKPRVPFSECWIDRRRRDESKYAFSQIVRVCLHLPTYTSEHTTPTASMKDTSLLYTLQMFFTFEVREKENERDSDEQMELILSLLMHAMRRSNRNK